jgi:hypothetical protein
VGTAPLEIGRHVSLPIKKSCLVPLTKTVLRRRIGLA